MKTKDLLKKIIVCSTLVSLPASLAGCTAETGQEPLIVLESGDDEATYTLVECTRDDVQETQPLRCVYTKEDEQEVYFPVSGKLIDKVYVSEGDEVKKGDLLVALAVGNLKADIANLEYRIKRNELQLGYIDEEESLDSQTQYLNFMFLTNGDEDAKSNLNKGLEELKENNDYRRQSINDSLEFDRKALANLKNEYANSRVYAQFDGKVSTIAENLEGSTSNIEKCIMTIVDNSEGFFVSEDESFTKYFSEDSVVSMRVVSGSGKGDYELVPYDMEGWGEKQFFRIFSGENADSLEAGTKGEMTVVTSEHKNVLCLPSNCVRSAGEDSYVYVVNDEGLREVVWVEVGLSGNGKTEIISGLNEGDSVIKS